MRGGCGKQQTHIKIVVDQSFCKLVALIVFVVGATQGAVPGKGGRPASALRPSTSNCSQVFQLMWILMSIPAPASILVQNPPSIPALAAAWLACRLRGSRFVIDWHNFGYTVLAQSKGWSNAHPLVLVAYMYEALFARLGDAHLCVTHAMAEWMRRQWGIHAHPLHDMAPEFFQPPSAATVHELLTRMPPLATVPSTPPQLGGTLLTQQQEDGRVTWRKDRPAMLISSTSWTPDEDFGILLKALQLYDAAASKRKGALPPLLCVVTGKGPQKDMYLQRIDQLQLSRVHVTTAWLEAGDYPTMVGAADLGVCLHTSTSGLDLPMKVVDMFGAGVPVAAVQFPCLHELVQNGENGLVFQSAATLAEQLQVVFEGFPWGERGGSAGAYTEYREAQGQISDRAGELVAQDGGVVESKCGEAPPSLPVVPPSAPCLLRMRAHLAQQGGQRWAENWQSIAAPLFA